MYDWEVNWRKLKLLEDQVISVVHDHWYTLVAQKLFFKLESPYAAVPLRATAHKRTPSSNRCARNGSSTGKSKPNIYERKRVLPYSPAP